MSVRQKQVASALHRAISEALVREMQDPRIKGMVSVTQVEVTADLHDANVLISVLPEQYASRTLRGLQHAAGHLQTVVNRAMRMRRVPRLHFKLDPSLKKQAELLEAIRQDPIPPSNRDTADDADSPEEPDSPDTTPEVPHS